MRVLQVVPGYAPQASSRDNIFIHGQIQSLARRLPAMDVVYAGLGSNARDMIRLYQNIRRLVKSNRPQIIHSQYATMTGMVTLWAASGIPVIVSFGGDEIYGTYRNERSTLSLRTILARICSQYCARHARVSIVKNSQMGEIVRRWGARKISDIPNGVNVDLFRPMDQGFCKKKLGLEADTRYVVFSVRGDDYVKRYDLAKAAIQYCSQMSEQRIQLLTLENTPPDDVPVYLNAGNVLLLCSNHEGSPNIVKEALACDRPVVSTDVGDVRQRFSQINGVILAPQDPPAIAQALLQAIRQNRSDGRQYALDLSEEIIAGRIVQLYEEIHSGRC